ncbi:hypothetical protein LCGC14_1916710, partial [marine sediment metagenome]
LWGWNPSAAAERLVQSRLLAKGSSLVVLGCGYGRECKFFVENGFAVTGVDWSSKGIEIAKKLQPRGLSYALICMDLCLFLETTRTNWDCVFVNHTFAHLEQELRFSVYGDIRRCLRDRGIFCLAEPSVNDTCYERCKKAAEENTWTDHRGLITHFFSEKELRGCLAGQFNIIEMEEISEAHSSSRTVGAVHTHSVLYCTVMKL